MTTAPLPAPTWPHCDDLTSPDGCRGVRTPGRAKCLAHLTPPERIAYLGTIQPGDDVDARGTRFTPELLHELLDRLYTYGTAPRFGTADFFEASFIGDATFHRAVFDRYADFRRAAFAEPADFTDAEFHREADFDRAVFAGHAWFGGAVFDRQAGFARAAFAADAAFNEVTFGGNVSFKGVRFAASRWLGPLTVNGTLDLEDTVFAVPATLDFWAWRAQLGRARFEGPATVRAYAAVIDLTEVETAGPLTVASSQDHGTPRPPGFNSATASITSLHRVDAALLILRDIDFSQCRFSEVHHLDQLGLDGECTFAVPPAGLRRGRYGPIRWSRRQVLAEEHHWRAADRHQGLAAGWEPGPSATPGSTPGPAALAVQYRKLRKAFEDGKDEPGAADFYYGEMEMRRHDRRRTTWGVRGLLHAYWLLSGYGLRATRAFAWLLVAMALTWGTLVLLGLPNSDPQPQATGIQAAPGRPVLLTIDTPDPVLTGPLSGRLSGPRAEKAVHVVLNSVIFRSSDQTLTTTGTYTEMTSRLLEPVLLGLGLLAIRSRVKR